MHTIYVYLRNEGTDVWRSVSAEPLGDNIYRIMSVNEDPDDEEWEFDTGDIVRCEAKEFSEGKHGIVAIERLSDPPQNN